jgi:hypothetical protein
MTRAIEGFSKRRTAMTGQTFAVDPATVPWKSLTLEQGGMIELQIYLKGTDGGPEAIRAKISDGYEVEPHFHLAAQFQLLLEGSMTFPTFRLDAPAVHYTEHNVPYGPFIVQGHDMLVLHTKPGGGVTKSVAGRRIRVGGNSPAVPTKSNGKRCQGTTVRDIKS